jgi:hypothetical protein
MPNATAFVTVAATTRCACGNICGCQRMRDAGWTVKCYSCGCGLDRPLADVLSEAMDSEPEWILESEDRIRHRGDRLRRAFDGAGDWYSVEPQDVERDGRLTDACERMAS